MKNNNNLSNFLGISPEYSVGLFVFIVMVSLYLMEKSSIMNKGFELRRRLVLKEKMGWQLLGFIGIFVFLFACGNNLNSLLKICGILMFISVSSMFLILSSGGHKDREMIALSIVKFIPDIFILLFLSCFCILGIYYDFLLNDPLSCFVYEHLGFISFILGFYSLLFMIVFWLKWGMEAKSLYSCFLHSISLIFVGVFFSLVMLSYGCLNSYRTIYFIIIFSSICYFVYMILFLCTFNLKRSVGFISASSICYLFLLLIIGGPYLGFIGFIIVSSLKIGLFCFMDSMKRKITIRESLLGVFILVLMLIGFHFILFPFIYNTFTLDISGFKFYLFVRYPFLYSFVLYFIPLLEIIGLILHFCRIVYSCRKKGNFIVSHFKINLMVLEGLYFILSIFFIFELFFIWKVKFHGVFIIIFVVLLLIMGFIMFYFSSYIGLGDEWVRNKITNSTSKFLNLYFSSSKDRAFFEILDRLLVHRVFGFKLGYLMFIVFLLIWSLVFVIYISQFYSCTFERSYVFDIFGNKRLNPVVMSSSPYWRRVICQLRGGDKLAFSYFCRRTWGVFNNYDLTNGKTSRSQGGYTYNLMACKLLELKNEFIYSGQSIDIFGAFTVSSFIMIRVNRQALVIIFYEWMSTIWGVMGLEDKMKWLDITKDWCDWRGFPLKEYLDMDYERNLNRGVIGVAYRFLSTIVWGSVRGCLYPFTDIGDGREYDLSAVVSGQAKLYSGSMAYLWEVFHCMSELVWAKPECEGPCRFKAAGGIYRLTVYYMCNMLGAPSDGRLILVRHKNTFDSRPLWLSFFTFGERWSNQLKKEGFVFDIMDMVKGDFLKALDHMNHRDTEFPWYRYEGYNFVAPNRTPEDPTDPCTFWSQEGRDLMGFGSKKGFNWPHWDVEFLGDDERSIRISRDFIMEFCKFESEGTPTITLRDLLGDDIIAVHMSRACNLLLYAIDLVLGTYTWKPKVRYLIWDALHKREEWVEYYYNHDKERSLPYYVYNDETQTPGREFL